MTSSFTVIVAANYVYLAGRQDCSDELIAEALKALIRAVPMPVAKYSRAKHSTGFLFKYEVTLDQAERQLTIHQFHKSYHCDWAGDSQTASKHTPATFRQLMKLRCDRLFSDCTFSETYHYDVLHNDWLDPNGDDGGSSASYHYVDMLRNSWVNYLRVRPYTVSDMMFITSASHPDDSAALELMFKVYGDIDWQIDETLLLGHCLEVLA